MSIKHQDSINLLKKLSKKLTAIVGLAGTGIVLGFPALAQTNPRPSIFNEAPYNQRLNTQGSPNQISPTQMPPTQVAPGMSQVTPNPCPPGMRPNTPGTNLSGNGQAGEPGGQISQGMPSATAEAPSQSGGIYQVVPSPDTGTEQPGEPGQIYQIIPVPGTEQPITPGTELPTETGVEPVSPAVSPTQQANQSILQLANIIPVPPSVDPDTRTRGITTADRIPTGEIPDPSIGGLETMPEIAQPITQSRSVEPEVTPRPGTTTPRQEPITPEPQSLAPSSGNMGSEGAGSVPENPSISAQSGAAEVCVPITE